MRWGEGKPGEGGGVGGQALSPPIFLTECGIKLSILLILQCFLLLLILYLSAVMLLLLLFSMGFATLIALVS